MANELSRSETIRTEAAESNDLGGIASEFRASLSGKSVAAWSPTSRARLWIRFFGGMLWLAILAAGLAGLSGYRFIIVYPATVAASLAAAGVILSWLTRWAMNRKAQKGQFGIGSLFYLTTLAAMYLAAIRWVVIQIEAQAQDTLHWPGVISVGFFGTFVIVITCPAVFGLTEALLWFAVWFVHWPPARPLLKRLLRRR